MLGLQLRATEWLTGAETPDPDNWTVGEFVALLEIKRLPVTAPAALGSKVTATVTDWFGAKVTPDPPLAEKPVPEAVTVEMLRFALPEFVKTTGCEDDVPTVTFPKLTLEVLGETWGADATPVPDRLTV